MMTSRKFRFVTQGAAARVLVALAVVACLAAVVPVALATDTDCDGNETDGGGYSCTLNTGTDQIPDISTTGTAIGTWYPKGCSGDDCYALVDLTGGKTFTWYGNSYSSVYVGSNGYVSFGTGYTQEVSTLSIPSTTDPDNAIFAYGDDLDPGSGGTVYYQQTTCNFDLDGDGSNDTCLVVQWDSVEYYGSTNTVTAQVALDLDIAKAVVEVVTENDPSGGEKPQLVGSENSYGTAGLWYKNGTDVDSRAATDGHQFIFSPDLDSPAVSSTTPADDATDVAVDADVVINFDEAMDTSSVTLTVVSGTDPGNWSPTWSNGNQTVTYTHDDFDDDADFVLKVTGTDTAGNSLTAENHSDETCSGGYCWNFSTVDQTAPSDVSLMSSTSSDLRVTLQWTNPSDSDFDGVLVLRKEGSAVDASPTDGTTYDVGDTIGTGNTVVCVTSSTDTSCIDNTVNNGSTYYYKAFAFDTSKNYASGVTGKGMPRATSTFKWAYTTSASTLAPSGVVAARYVVSTGNDQRLHRLNEDDGLRTNWSPLLLGGAVQSRPMVGDLDGTGDYTAFFTAQNGYLYRYSLADGTTTSEGSANVVSDAGCSSGILQAGPVVMLDRFDGNSINGDDGVIVATRCGTTDNKILLYSLDLGTVLDTYDGGTNGLGISNATPRILYLDNTTNKVYVPVRADDADQKSLVVLSVGTGPAFSLYATITGRGDVDATPIVVEHGSDYLLLFGNTDGQVFSYNALVLDGTSLRFNDSYDGGDGAVKGIAVSTQILDPNTGIYYHWVVWTTDTKVHGIKLQGNGTFDDSSYWTKTLSSPSVPLVLRWVGGTENTYAYVGAGDGYLYELDCTDSGSTNRSWIVESGTTVGDPTFDYNDGTSQGIVVGTTGGTIHWVSLD